MISSKLFRIKHVETWAGPGYRLEKNYRFLWIFSNWQRIAVFVTIEQAIKTRNMLIASSIYQFTEKVIYP